MPTKKKSARALVTRPVRATEKKSPARCPDDLGDLAEQLGGRVAKYGANLLGGGISRLFGKGDYEVRANSLVSSYGGPTAGPAPPAMFRGPRHGTRVVEREYIGSITGNTTFTNTSFRINPADSDTFPWLSRVATGFEQWEPNGIVFEFRSTSSVYNGASQALGVVVMATDYDPTDPPFASRSEMANADYSNTFKSSEQGIHGVECEVASRPTRLLYTSAPTPTGADARFADLGNFQIATDGLAAPAVIGELWVAYDITFYKKSLSEPDSTGHWAAAGATGTVTTSDWLGVPIVVAEGLTLTSVTNGLRVTPLVLSEDHVGRVLVLTFSEVAASGVAFTTGSTTYTTSQGIGAVVQTSVHNSATGILVRWTTTITDPNWVLELINTTFNPGVSTRSQAMVAL
jgi:hypothetical protein